MLGPNRVGKGRKALEGARTGGWEQTRTPCVRRSTCSTVHVHRARSDRDRRIRVARSSGRGVRRTRRKLPSHRPPRYLADGRARRPRERGDGARDRDRPAAAGRCWRSASCMRDDDMRVRIQAAWAVDKLGDDAVRRAAAVPRRCAARRRRGHRGGDARARSRKTRVLGALAQRAQTDDDAHARRIIEVINVLADAPEILCDAIEAPQRTCRSTSRSA